MWLDNLFMQWKPVKHWHYKFHKEMFLNYVFLTLLIDFKDQYNKDLTIF